MSNLTTKTPNTMNTSLSLPTTAPVVTYKKVYSKYYGGKVNRVFVDGVAKYDIIRLYNALGFECYSLDPNLNGVHDQFVCGGYDVLLREVKEIVEGIVLKAYNEALNTPTTEVHKAANKRHFEAMGTVQSAIEAVETDKVVTSIDGEELPELLSDTFQTIFEAGMDTPTEATTLNELSNVANMVYEAQQMLKEATEAMEALRARAALLGTNNDNA